MSEHSNEAVSATELERMRSELDKARQRVEQGREVVRELRRSEELTRRLIEAMPGGVVHVSADGAIQTANAEAQRILGLSYDELSHRFVVDFEPKTIFEDGSPCTAEEYPVTQAIVTGQPQPPCTIGVVRPDGAISWAVFTAVPIKEEDGTTSGAVVTFIDITRRKQLEQELRDAQKMEAIGRLAGGIAHDFNNLLTVIVGNTSCLRMSLPENAPGREDLDQVLQAAKQATSLTGQLLAFARRQLVTPKLLYLDALVDETASLLRRLIGSHIELRIQHAEGLWPVRVDRSQFEQVIVNLSLNARDAMGDGGVLTLSTENRREHGEPEQVVLRVSDTGAGIEAETLQHIFEPFFTTKEVGRGTGLGLATCYGVAKQAGGSIGVDSTPGVGTSFEVRIPRAHEEAETEMLQSRAPRPESGAEALLLVEDEPAVRRVLARGLQRLGYRVLTAENGKDALALLREQNEVDVLVSDVVMPGMTGPEVVAQARRVRPELPVVFISGYPDDALQHREPAEPPVVYLRKPFDPESLAATIRTLLGEAQGP